MQVRSLLRAHALRLLMSVAMALTLSIALMGAFATVHAASRGNVGQLVTRMTVPLNVDCSSVPNTSRAHAILAQHHLCGYGKSSVITVPTTRVCGNCGCLSLALYNSGGGYVQWRGEITSSLGAMVNAFYSGSILNNDTHQGGPVNRNSGVIFTSDWLDIFPIYTRPGHVYGKITYAQDLLWWGATCTNTGLVYAYATVT